MNTFEALATFAADLKEAARTFKPASPIAAGETNAGDTSASKSNADYRLDLSLQNLLAIGSEFAPDDIISLRKRARYGDARWLYSLYDEMMRLGPAPQVLKAREAIKGTRTVWHATPDEADEDENSNDPEDKAARLIRDVTEEAWDKWLPDIKTHLSTKFFYGIAAMQVMWKPQAIEGRWSKVTDIRPIPARRFRLDPQTMRFKFLTNPFSYEGPFVDDLQKTGKLIFVEVGADTEPLDQRGLLFQCLIPWAIEQFTVRWRAKRLQNFGMPPVMVKYPKGDPGNKAIADQLADMLATGTRASMTTDMSAELLSASSGGRAGDPYEAAIEWCERAYDKTILGHSQVSGVQQGAGSKSSGKDAIGLFKDVTNSRAKELDGDITQQCFFPYVSREWGDTWAENHTPATESAVVERDDPVELSTVALNLFNAGAAGAIAVEDLVERTTLKVAEDGELTLGGNVKGETPSAGEIDAINKATPAGLGEQAHVEVDGEGKAVQKIKKQPIQPVVVAPGAKPGKPGAKPAKVPASSQAETKGGSFGAGEFMTMADVMPAARAVLKKRKGNRRAAIMEFYTKRQRFAAASLVGGRPRVTITTFGHDFGAPQDTAMNIDVRSMSGARPYDIARTGNDPDVKAALESHPMTGAIYGGVKSRAKQAISAAKLVGEHELHLGVGCEHGKHRSVYVGERLAQDLRNDGEDVTVEHRDAHTASGERGIAHDEPNVVDAAERFYSEDQPRDDNGRWAGGTNAATTAETARSKKEHETSRVYHRYAQKALANAGFEKAAEAHGHAAGMHEAAKEGFADRVEAHDASRAAHTITAAALLAGLGKHASAPGQLFTSIETVGEAKKTRLSMEARIAVRVRKRLKAQHALASKEAKHRLARAE